MARRIRRPPVQRRTAVANYLVSRADAEKRLHPEKSYAQIGRELGIRQKDPARLIRKLRTGETSGRRVVPEVLGLKRPPGGGPLQAPPGRFVVAYQWWYLANPAVRYWARTNIIVNASRLDIFRLRDDPRVDDAVRRHLLSKAARSRGTDNYPRDISEVDYEIDSVMPEATARARQFIIMSRSASV